jgi:GTP cyclohydrolase IA
MEESARRVSGWERHHVEVSEVEMRPNDRIRDPTKESALGVSGVRDDVAFDCEQVDLIEKIDKREIDRYRFSDSGEAVGGIDLIRAARAVADLLDALGVNRESESLAGTPDRVARAYAELLTPLPFEATTFPNDEAYDELVLARDIPFSSLCEHHLLPFTGVAHVGYLPGKRLLGLSKLARVVTHYSHRLQVQERLTKQVADWLVAELDPKGVGVVLVAEHTCMSMRGVRATGARTVTSALAGLVRDDQRTRSEFMSLVGPSA